MGENEKETVCQLGGKYCEGGCYALGLVGRQPAVGGFLYPDRMRDGDPGGGPYWTREAWQVYVVSVRKIAGRCGDGDVLIRWLEDTIQEKKARGEIR